MRNRILFAAVIAVFFCLPAFTQVAITAKKTTYTRPKPIADFKRKFTVIYPKVKAATPAISRKIESAISYEKIFDFKLKEEIREIQWLEEASYDVIYNKGNILCVRLMMEGSGAYPSTASRYIVVDTANGTRTRPLDVFTKTDALLAKLIKMKDAEVKKAIEDIKNDPETKNEDVSDLFSNAETYQKVKLDEFSVTSRGVTFHHDYGFPHVALALQPPGEFFLSWVEIRPYLKRSGLLSPPAR